MQFINVYRYQSCGMKNQRKREKKSQTISNCVKFWEQKMKWTYCLCVRSVNGYCLLITFKYSKNILSSSSSWPSYSFWIEFTAPETAAKCQNRIISINFYRQSYTFGCLCFSSNVAYRNFFSDCGVHLKQVKPYIRWRMKDRKTKLIKNKTEKFNAFFVTTNARVRDIWVCGACNCVWTVNIAVKYTTYDNL